MFISDIPAGMHAEQFIIMWPAGKVQRPRMYQINLLERDDCMLTNLLAGKLCRTALSAMKTPAGWQSSDNVLAGK